MTAEAWIALGGLAVAALSGGASYLASSIAVRVHLDYLRRDVDGVGRSVRSAHWRLDQIQAPPAPGGGQDR